MKKGFTLVELLAVIVLLGIIMAIAIPGIYKIRDKMNEKALEAKINTIETAAVSYVQSNSNLLKSHYGLCDINNQNENCVCKNEDECNYQFTINIKTLITSGDLKRETLEGEACAVPNPTDKNKCLDCLNINITLSSKYKTATAKLDLNAGEC